MIKLRINRPLIDKQWKDKPRLNQQCMARKKLVKLLFTFNILLIALIMSGCITSALSGNPKPLMNSGIMTFEKKLKVPLFDGADYLEISPDNRYLFVGGDKSKYYNLYDLVTGKIIKRFLSYRYAKEGEREVSDEVSFSADSKKIYIKSLNHPPEGRRYYVFDIQSLTFADEIEWELGRISDVSRDGRYIIYTGPGSYQGQDHYNKKPLLALYDAKTHELISAVRKGFNSEKAIFTPDAKYVIDVGSLGDRLEDTTEPAIRIWSVPDLELVGVIENAFINDEPKLSVDGRLIDHSESADILNVSSDGKYLYLQKTEYITLGNGESSFPDVVVIFDLHKKEQIKKTMAADIVANIPKSSHFEPTGVTGLSKNDRYYFQNWFSGEGEYNLLAVDAKSSEVVERIKLPKSIFSVGEKVSTDGTKLVISQAKDIYIYQIND